MAELASLKAAVEKTKSDLDAAHKRAAEHVSERRVADSRGILDTLDRQRGEFAEEEAQATKAAKELRTQAETLQKRLADMPATELALRPLKRSLEETERLVKARDASAADARQAAEYYATGDVLDTTGFGVDQWAVAPVSPSGPNRTRWLATAVALGLGIGFGLFKLLGRFEDGTIHAPENFADLVPGALVVLVPLLGEGGVRRKVSVRLDLVLGDVGRRLPRRRAVRARGAQGLVPRARLVPPLAGHEAVNAADVPDRARVLVTPEPAAPSSAAQNGAQVPGAPSERPLPSAEAAPASYPLARFHTPGRSRLVARRRVGRPPPRPAAAPGRAHGRRLPAHVGARSSSRRPSRPSARSAS